MRMLRNLLALTLFVVPSAGLAQTTPTTTTPVTTLTATDFLIALWADPNKTGDTTILSAYEAERFFNTARCECNSPLTVRVGFTQAGTAKSNTITKGQYKVIIGPAACVSADAAALATSEGSCTSLAEGKLVGIKQNGGYIEAKATVGQFFEKITTGCRGTRRLENIRLWIDVNEDNIPDLADQSAPSLPLQLDTDPPPQPTEVTVRGGNEALDVSWQSLVGQDDFQGYMVLCSRGEDLAVFKDSGFSNQFMTRDTQCGSAVTATNATLSRDEPKTLFDPRLLAQTIDSKDDTGRGPFPGPKPFADLDPDYLCSSLITTGTSTRIEGLQNGIPYLIGVGAVDRSGNVSQIRDVYLQAPLATRDFYTGYRAAGGEAEGGFCNVGGGKSRATLPWLAALAVIGGLLLARRVARANRQR